MSYVAVKFLHPFHLYNVNEIAGFPAERAKALVDGKVAVAYVEPKSPELADELADDKQKKKTSKSKKAAPAVADDSF